MSALYWQDFDCDAVSLAIEHTDVIHLHHANERGACLEHDDGRRYFCIRGPGGLVRGVRR